MLLNLKNPTENFISNIEHILVSREKFLIEQDKLTVLQNVYSNLRDLFLLEFYYKKDIIYAKQICFEIAKAKEAYHYYFGQADLQSKPVHIENYTEFSLAILCDKIDLLKKFQKWEYPVFHYTKNTENRQYFVQKQGQPYSYAMQCIINQDWEALNNTINGIKILATKTYWKSRHFDLHIDVWESIRDSNSDNLRNNLQQLIKKTHKTFTMGHLWGNFISMPAVGYLKAAWLIGLEVEVDNKLIPMELMPFQPLESYKCTFPYFLNE